MTSQKFLIKEQNNLPKLPELGPVHKLYNGPRFYDFPLSELFSFALTINKNLHKVSSSSIRPLIIH